MKYLLLLFGFIIYSCASFAQKNEVRNKKVLDTILNIWENVASPMISENGRFAGCIISNRPQKKNTLLVKTTDGSWQREFVLDSRIETGALGQFFFSNDEKSLVFKDGDKLNFLNLKTKNVDVILDVETVGLPDRSIGEWIGFMKHKSDTLYIYNVINNKYYKCPNVSSFKFDPFGKSILFKKLDKKDDVESVSLEVIDLKSTKQRCIWRSDKVLDEARILMRYYYNFGGDQVFFTTGKGVVQTELWSLKLGNDSAQIVFNTFGSRISNIRFSSKSNFVIIELGRATSYNNKSTNNLDLWIWNYKDPILVPERMRLRENELDSSITFVLNTATLKSVKLTSESETICWMEGDYAIIMDNNFVTEYWWSFQEQPSFWIVSLSDGKRRLLKANAGNFNNGSCTVGDFSLSPQGDRLAFWDKDSASYFVVDLNKSDFLPVNISKKVDADFRSSKNIGVYSRAAASIESWSADGKFIYIYDEFDLWKLDASDRQPATCLTNRIGITEKIHFRIVNSDKYTGANSLNDEKQLLLLVAFNSKNNFNGFYRLDAKGGVLIPLVMTPSVYYLPNNLNLSGTVYYDKGMVPIKARNKDVWLVKRQSDIEAPNFFITKNFKYFISITDISPHADTRWLKAELIHWSSKEGDNKGVLYKPENFDSSQKYPIIFTYYQEMSWLMYQFQYPRDAYATLSVSWFVNHGYLVFAPDLHFSLASTSGKVIGEDLLEAITSAGRHLSNFSFVDSKRMGLYGHSFGGFQTNYIITHTDMFSAAVEFAGNSDALSSYLSLTPFMSPVEHSIKQSALEIGGTGYGAYGGDPWRFPEFYRRNSPVLNADKVSTPLLMVHNPKDNQIPYRQGVELFLSLRRLCKPVWFLQYNRSGHILESKSEAADLTNKLTGFYDYYLKHLDQPTWMKFSLK